MWQAFAMISQVVRVGSWPANLAAVPKRPFNACQIDRTVLPPSQADIGGSVTVTAAGFQAKCPLGSSRWQGRRGDRRHRIKLPPTLKDNAGGRRQTLMSSSDSRSLAFIRGFLSCRPLAWSLSSLKVLCVVRYQPPMHANRRECCF